MTDSNVDSDKLVARRCPSCVGFSEGGKCNGRVIVYEVIVTRGFHKHTDIVPAVVRLSSFSFSSARMVCCSVKKKQDRKFNLFSGKYALAQASYFTILLLLKPEKKP